MYKFLLELMYVCKYVLTNTTAGLVVWVKGIPAAPKEKMEESFILSYKGSKGFIFL